MSGRIQVGMVVEVVEGLSKGLRGTVREQAKVTWDGLPMFAVDFPWPLRLRVIRSDFLRAVEAS